MNKEKAFTLVELLVVISIIALLLSILLPSLSKARELAKTASCASNMKQINAGAALWSGSHDDWAPGAWWWYPEKEEVSLGSRTDVIEATIVGYINATVSKGKRADVLVCPSARREQFFTWGNNSDDISGDSERNTRLTYGGNAGILHYSYNVRLLRVQPGPGTVAKSSAGVWYGDNVEYVFDHGATKMASISRPSSRPYFLELAYFTTEMYYFDPIRPPEMLRAYQLYGQKVAARWHNPGCNNYGYGYGNIAWVDGHVSKEPKDFDDIPEGRETPRWEQYMWE